MARIFRQDVSDLPPAFPTSIADDLPLGLASDLRLFGLPEADGSRLRQRPGFSDVTRTESDKGPAKGLKEGASSLRP